MLLGVFFLIIGILMITQTRKVWELTDGKRSRNATGPTPFYLWTNRLIGVCFIVVGVINIQDYLA
ncbi:DUF6199 family natural product biosynthesis protein [Thalassobacillus hwangdonensis]|uniref:DUF6199 family natural product biosynthesis protein n=1 Tax=Thalassobacillus hwangdonensis TaxID=546108 RepID=A0ABW3L394_9BACI